MRSSREPGDHSSRRASNTGTLLAVASTAVRQSTKASYRVLASSPAWNRSMRPTLDQRHTDAVSDDEITVQPITPKLADDLDSFSRAHGRFRWCSCMSWRMPSTEFRNSDKEERAARLASLVEADKPVGLLAYSGDIPIGWCSVAPRESYGALVRSRVLAPVDEKPVWSIVCMFVDSGHRRRGVASALLRGAVDYAHSMSAVIIEGYPVEPGKSYSHMGTVAMFESAGFVDVTPAGRSRAVMRRDLTG